MELPLPHYDGDYTVRTQVGEAVFEVLLLEQATLVHVSYHQFAASFVADQPTWNDIGEAGTAWAGLPVVDVSSPTDLGAGICAFTITYATTPRPHFEPELFGFEYQRVVLGEIQSLSIPTRSTITYTYFYAIDPRTIATARFYRATKVGNIILFVGTPPPAEALQFLGEDETVERWKGHFWRKKSRTVPQLTWQTLG